MTVFRWIIGVLSALLAAGSLLSFVLFIAFDINVWLERARSLRRGTTMALLLWFNVEVWGRVIWTLVHW
ncbi:MAG: hypothetical protein KGL99_04145 [Burkholderiales bacterium]|nr:hypothetical protein [Burkholderiales bacterium]MDE2298414.1 hypothetical protein [Burkholderiales bacterium]MDE2626323.1 hypothetical protein [Burkholderiales bacterium]